MSPQTFRREDAPLSSNLPWNEHRQNWIRGDVCLRKVAQELEKGIKRPGDFIGRYGGEEFSVILSDCDTEGAALVAENLRARVAALKIPHARSTAADHVTVSIGYTTQIVGADSTWSGLMEEADKALYLAKKRGRNCASGYEGN